MRTSVAIALSCAFLAGTATARGADLRERAPYPAYACPRLGYEDLWAGRVARREGGPLRPHRRVMGGPDYVGDNWGLGKPPVSGIGPRPDWGRSTYD